MKLLALAALLSALAGIAAAAAHRLDGAVIVNSGSTNFTGYTIAIRSDGTAQYMDTSARVPRDLAEQLLVDARTAKQTGKATGVPCMKAVSFGTTTIVRYHGWRSPDLQCPGSALTQSLRADVQRITEALGLGNTPKRSLRRAVMPNSVRRPEPTSSAGTGGQPSAMPESPPETP
jgi:hypothetical protein